MLRLGAALLLLAALSRSDELSAGDVVVRFPAPARPMAERVLKSLPERRELAARWLGLEPRGRVRVVLVADPREMAAVAPGAPSWSVAVTEADGTVVARLDLLDRTRGNGLEKVLSHESVHLALNGRPRPPRWFEEGLAVHHAGVAYLDVDTTLERYAASGRLPRFADADRLFAGTAPEAALGYELGARAVGTFVRRFGDDAVRRLVGSMNDGAAFPEAFATATGEPLGEFERRWLVEVTPKLPSWLLVIAENLDLALLTGGGLLVALGYLRWRIRRERAMAGLGGGAPEDRPV